MEQQQEPPELSPEEQLEQAEAALASYRSLVKFPAWGILASFLHQQADTRISPLLAGVADNAQSSGVDAISQIFQNEFQKGIRMGLKMAADTPRTMVEFLERAVMEARLQLADDAGEDTSGIVEVLREMH